MTAGMPDMAALLAQAQQMQEQILAAQASLANVHVQGTAGGGLVTATVTAAGELIGLEISPQAVDPEDTETLADLILAAFRDAHRVAAEVTAQTMGPFAAGMGLGDGIMADLGLSDFMVGEVEGGGGAFGLPPGR
ncbi:MAG TPA: YbaB/EbfC family nucleoid-associated protein [Sporichthyaceae bacterium]|nr:YbaB/EbfC family nucleoid-associated protein [Sporichthyaceae bacterium]